MASCKCPCGEILHNVSVPNEVDICLEVPTHSNK